MRKYLQITVIALAAFYLISCAAAFDAVLMGETATALEAGEIAAGISEISSVSAAELAAEGILAEDIAILRSSVSGVRAGRLMTADEMAFNRELGKIRLGKGPGDNPKLFLNNAEKAFGEVLPESGQFRIYTLQKNFPIDANIFSVEVETVNIVRDPRLAATVDNVVGTANKGDLVIKLSHREGWYRINVIKNEQVISGFVPVEAIAALAIGNAIMADSVAIDDNTTCYEVIAAEAKRRQLFSERTGGREAVKMTPQDAFDLLYDAFSYNTAERIPAYTAADWPKEVSDLLNVNASNIPLLSSRDFEDQTLKIIVFTKPGEVLQVLEWVNENQRISEGINFFPDNGGTWAKVKTIQGNIGWLLVRSLSSQYDFASTLVRYQPQPESKPVSNQTVATGKKEESAGSILLAVAIVVCLLVVLARRSS